MTLRSLLDASDLTPTRRWPRPGHDHFWQRAAMSRRRFLGSTAGATGLALGAGMLARYPALAARASRVPKPIPGGTVLGGTLFHLFLPSDPGPGADPSVITDFNGAVGLAEITGRGTDGDGNELFFSVDNRFMQGEFIGLDGRHFNGTFGFF